MMNLKQAYAYLSKLSNDIDEMSRLICSTDFVYDQKSILKKSMVLKTEEDEIVDERMLKTVSLYTNDYEKFGYNEVLNLLNDFIDEYQKLLYAVDSFKDESGYITLFNPVLKTNVSLSVDDAIKYNSKIRKITSSLEQSLSMKDKERTKFTQSYVNGTEGPVKVDVPLVTSYTVKYNKEEIENMFDAYINFADELSLKIDEIMSRDIKFEPKYSRYKKWSDILYDLTRK